MKCSVEGCDQSPTYKGQAFFVEGWEDCFGDIYFCNEHMARLEELNEKYYENREYHEIPYEEQLVRCEYIDVWPQPMQPEDYEDDYRYDEYD